MNGLELRKTANALVAGGRGILAMDESPLTCGKRLQSVAMENTGENRRRYRRMLLTAPGLAQFVGGVILHDETLRQEIDGVPIPELTKSVGITPGIKVDTGTKDLAGHSREKITEGLDNLRGRLAEYAELGARFCKWRAVITIGDGIPTRACLEANAHALARYGSLCQEQDLMPIVEPEILLDGDHSIQRCHEVTEETLPAVFTELAKQRVASEGVLLKASMVMAGKDSPHQADVQEVAERTIRCLMATVPASVPGIVFLSGGQGDRLATARLNAMNVLGEGRLPWPLSFSYARALQDGALRTWRGQDANVPAAQAALLHRAKCVSAAARGVYDEETMESSPRCVA